jgi:hypothetical protein
MALLGGQQFFVRNTPEVAGELRWQGRYNVISERARHGHVEIE